jgi:hypothetical protein
MYLSACSLYRLFGCWGNDNGIHIAYKNIPYVNAFFCNIANGKVYDCTIDRDGEPFQRRQVQIGPQVNCPAPLSEECINSLIPVLPPSPPWSYGYLKLARNTAWFAMGALAFLRYARPFVLSYGGKSVEKLGAPSAWSMGAAGIAGLACWATMGLIDYKKSRGSKKS